MFLRNKVKIVVITVLMLVVALTGYKFLEKPDLPEFTLLEEANIMEGLNGAETNNETSGLDIGRESAKVLVDIKGAITQPGVYELPAGSRIIDVVELAGGLNEDADSMQVNMASIIYDAMEIIIPKKGETIKPKAQDRSKESVSEGKINLNTANLSQLISLTGIGEAKAEAIISYREQHGGFKELEDLMKVSGIGIKTFTIIKDQITV